MVVHSENSVSHKATVGRYNCCEWAAHLFASTGEELSPWRRVTAHASRIVWRASLITALVSALRWGQRALMGVARPQIRASAFLIGEALNAVFTLFPALFPSGAAFTFNPLNVHVWQWINSVQAGPSIEVPYVPVCRLHGRCQIVVFSSALKKRKICKMNHDIRPAELLHRKSSQWEQLLRVTVTVVLTIQYIQSRGGTLLPPTVLDWNVCGT